jgi:hypothetical protein
MPGPASIKRAIDVTIIRPDIASIRVCEIKRYPSSITAEGAIGYPLDTLFVV